MSLLEWQNLIFIVPILLATVYLLVMAMGLGFGEHVGDASIDAHGDVDLADGADAGDVHDAADSPPGLAAALSILGIGRAPLSLLMVSLCFTWGVSGLIAGALLGAGEPWKSIVIASFFGIGLTGRIAGGVARLLPSVASYHTPARELVGLLGDVLFRVTADAGAVRVRDDRDTLRDVSARVAPGAPSIPAGGRVLLMSYDAATQSFLVEPVQSPSSARGTDAAESGSRSREVC